MHFGNRIAAGSDDRSSASKMCGTGKIAMLSVWNMKQAAGISGWRIMEYTDTIVAIATAMGNSGIGIVRISGENAVEIAEKVFRAPGKKKLSGSCESHDSLRICL